MSCQLLLGIDSTIVNVALPRIARDLHFGAAGLAWVLNAYTITFAGLLLLGGRLGDALGRRRVFIAGVLVFTAASLAAALARDPGQLLAARAVQGIGAALASPSTLALITTTFAEGPPRNRALGISSAVISGGASLGLVLGGVVTAAVSWRWVFLVNVPIGAAIVLLARRHLPETPRHVAGDTGLVDAAGRRRLARFDVPGALTGTLGMLGIVYSLIRAATAGWTDTRVLAGLAAGLTALVAFVLIERRTAAPIVPLGLFRDRARASGYVSLLLIGPSMIGPFFFLTTYLQQVRGLGPVATGLAFLPMTLGLFTAARTVARLLGRFGSRRVIGGALVGLAAAELLLSRVGPATSYAAILGPLALVGIGGGLSFVPIYTLILSRVEGASAGSASGVLQTVQWLGGSFGLAVLVAAGHPYVVAAALAVGALVLMTSFRHAKTHPDVRLRAGGRERPDGPGHPDEVEQPSASRTSRMG
ncbi:MFS transporter [Dactylosporangium vinaceum]|uniref:MFS transporter n=1 Tax=Dactylosporangium vinaceum TaxID=53362 RepID=A0ABV5M6F3_9ACTN|nr:MFS transporter [Dactylosporangium vinaceum]